MNNNGELGTGWLKFYIYVRFPISFILGALGIIYSIGMLTEHPYLNNGYWLLVGFDIAIYVFRVVVFIFLLKKSGKGYVLNFWLLYIESIYFAINQLISARSYVSFFLVALPLAVLWSVLNYNYFRNREYLFEGTYSASLRELREMEKELFCCVSCKQLFKVGKSDQICGCSKCGGRLIDTGCTVREWDELGKEDQKKRMDKIVAEAASTLPQQAEIRTAEQTDTPAVKQLPAAEGAIKQGNGEESETADSFSPEKNKVEFCRFCGSDLLEGAPFCRKCGRRVFEGVTESDITEKKEDDAEELVIQKDKEEKVPAAVKIELNELPPKLQRAFLFLEDGEWERADRYLEAYLDEDPMNAYAYLGKAMLELKKKTPETLAENVEALKDNKSYAKAVRFADEGLKNRLML